MAQIDKQKEIIGYLKTGFFFLLGVLFGLIAYLFNGYDKISIEKLVLVEFALLLNVAMLFFVASLSKKYIDELEEM